MKLDFLDSKDLWAGVMLIVTGAVAILIARDYPFGNSLRMGPGYFPIVLGALLIVFGLVIASSGLRAGERIEPNWSPRALIMLPLSFVLFGVLMDRAGFIPALVVLIVGAASAGTDFRPAEIALLTVVLTVFSVALFIWGLGLPYPLIVGL